MGALTGIKVVELAQSPAGEYCGKILAELGAEVWKVERPGTGSPTRSLARIQGAAGPEQSVLFAFLNTDKRSLEIDLETAEGKAEVRRLMTDAAVVIDDRSPAQAAELGLAPDSIAREYPNLVACLITRFGSSAPAEWNAVHSLNVFHASGWGYHTPSDADISRPPLKGAGCYTADLEGGLDAAIAVISCLVQLGRTGQGEFLDVSQQAALLNRGDTMIGRFLNGEDPPRPGRDAYDMPGPTASYACADGDVYLFVTSTGHWRGLRALTGDPPWMQEFSDDWMEYDCTPERIAKFRRHFAEWVSDKPKQEVSEQAQRLGTPLVPLSNAADLVASPQFIHREFFEPLSHPVLGEALYPTMPFVLSASPTRPRMAAPLLGEGKGASTKAPAAVKAQPYRHRRAPDASHGGPLAGVRVVQLTKVWAGPYVGKLLACLGAEVIKVESELNLDEMRAYGGIDINNAPFFLSLNHDVLSAQFNLKNPGGVAQLKELIADSDIVLNNLRPGAMERMGLGYDDLKKLRPDIISVAVKMYGNEGPLGYQTGYAPCFAALGGMNQLVGYDGEPPKNVCIRYGDATAGAYAALGAVAALAHRDRTGEGQFVDLSAVEAMASIVGDSLMKYALTGDIPGPDGNFHPDMAPHGAYPCADGRWISIAVGSDAEWGRLCGALGADALAAEPSLASLAGRQAARGRIDAAIADLTRNQDAAALADRLRHAGVGAFLSWNTEDMVSDPYLWDHGYYPMVSDHHKGSRPVTGPSWRMARTPPQIGRGAPLLGEHNDYVFRQILGLDEQAFRALKDSDAMR